MGQSCVLRLILKLMTCFAISNSIPTCSCDMLFRNQNVTLQIKLVASNNMTCLCIYVLYFSNNTTYSCVLVLFLPEQENQLFV